jgi:hypothetical protein
MSHANVSVCKVLFVNLMFYFTIFILTAPRLGPTYSPTPAPAAEGESLPALKAKSSEQRLRLQARL